MTATKAKKRAQAAPAPEAKAGTLEKMKAVAEGPQPVMDAAANGNGAKPAPQPGEKGFDWQAEYPDEQVYIYTTPKEQTDTKGNPIGGRTVGLAAISGDRQPSVGFLRRVRHRQEFDQIVDMIELVASDAALTVIDPWKPTDLQDLFEQWSAWSKTAAGES